jgi:hypothetical protein
LLMLRSCCTVIALSKNYTNKQQTYYRHVTSGLRCRKEGGEVSKLLGVSLVDAMHCERAVLYSYSSFMCQLLWPLFLRTKQTNKPTGQANIELIDYSCQSFSWTKQTDKPKGQANDKLDMSFALSSSYKRSWTHKWTNKLTHKQTNKQTNSQANSQCNCVKTNTQTIKQTNTRPLTDTDTTPFLPAGLRCTRDCDLQGRVDATRHRTKT